MKKKILLSRMPVDFSLAQSIFTLSHSHDTLELPSDSSWREQSWVNIYLVTRNTWLLRTVFLSRTPWIKECPSKTLQSIYVRILQQSLRKWGSVADLIDITKVASIMPITSVFIAVIVRGQMSAKRSLSAVFNAHPAPLAIRPVGTSKRNSARDSTKHRMSAMDV